MCSLVMEREKTQKGQNIWAGYGGDCEGMGLYHTRGQREGKEPDFASPFGKTRKKTIDLLKLLRQMEVAMDWVLVFALRSFTLQRPKGWKPLPEV